MATFSEADRKRLAKTGAAMPGGEFPIIDASSLEAAIHLVGKAKDPAAAKRHIIKRARALMLKSKLPLSWL